MVFSQQGQADDAQRVLAHIFDPEVSIAIYPRSGIDKITMGLDRLIADGTLGSSLRLTVEAGQPLPLPQWPETPGIVEWLMDITHLVEIYGELLGCRQMRLRLEVVHRAMCPRFHVDRVGIRLLCTYRGSATEWLDDRCADRTWLGAHHQGLPDEESGLIRDPAAVHRASPFAIMLLKGELWPGHAGRGAIHRSPAVPAVEAPRVLVALDAL